jgi:hypothetical protein
MYQQQPDSSKPEVPPTRKSKHHESTVLSIEVVLLGDTPSPDVDTCKQRRDRGRRRHTPTPPTHERSTRGMLPARSREVRERLLDEGVPAEEVLAVALQLWHCLTLNQMGGKRGDYDRAFRLLPWAAEILTRYQGKLISLFLANRAPVTRA